MYRFQLVRSHLGVDFHGQSIGKLKSAVQLCNICFMNKKGHYYSNYYRLWDVSQRSLFLYFSSTIDHVHKRHEELSLNEFSQIEIYTLNENKVILLLYQLILPYHENLPLTS